LSCVAETVLTCLWLAGPQEVDDEKEGPSQRPSSSSSSSARAAKKARTSRVVCCRSSLLTLFPAPQRKKDNKADLKLKLTKRLHDMAVAVQENKTVLGFTGFSAQFSMDAKREFLVEQQTCVDITGEPCLESPLFAFCPLCSKAIKLSRLNCVAPLWRHIRSSHGTDPRSAPLLLRKDYVDRNREPTTRIPKGVIKVASLFRKDITLHVAPAAESVRSRFKIRL
jgi:hypothetical protein